MYTLTRQQARQFLFLKHGLLGEHRFIGKEGALEFVRQAGCIQFDPVDACGKNAELTLQSRVKGFSKKMLAELLYKDRKLADYPDKQLAIIPVEDWPYFSRYRRVSLEGGKKFEGLAELETAALAYIEQQGPVSSDELPIEGTIHWHSHIHWSGNWQGESNAARSVLEQLYSTGELVIHHKKGSRKYYDLAIRHIDKEILEAEDPLPDEFEHQKWRVLRRIGAVGLMWDRPSDAWLNIWGLTTEGRHEIFRQLLEEGAICEVKVEGVRSLLYCRSEDRELIKEVQEERKWKARCEVIAPLDCLMWDRKLIRELFDFQYSWEIYTPVVKRKYGYYVLPMIYGDAYIGRVEAVADAKTKTLTVKNIWYEDGIRRTKKLEAAVAGCMKRLARFNECKGIKWYTC